MAGMDMSELLGVFLEEADEQLLQLDDGFLQLEKDPSNIETVKEVFRAAHTLKGSSATMGFAAITDLTHAMESLLDGVRNETIAADSAIIDLLLAANDALRKLIEQVRNSEPLKVDDESLARRLKAAAGADVDAETSDGPARVSNRYDPVEPGTVRLIVEISPDCMMPSVRAFMVHNSLTGLGEVLSAIPPPDDIDNVAAGQRLIINFRPSAEGSAVVDAINSLMEVELVDVVLPEDAAAAPASISKPAAAEAIEQTGKAIQTVRVGVERLDTLMNLVAELVIDRTRIAQIESRMSLELANEELVQNLGETAAHIGRVVAELQEHIMKVRLLPVAQIFNRFPRMVRDLSRRAGKSVEFVMEGQDTELDRSILEHIVDPITHLLRNAVDHGIEAPEARSAAGKPEIARVTLAARQEENRIIIIVEDDGRGIDVERVKRKAVEKGAVTEDLLARMTEQDCLQLIFASGVSTAEQVTDVSGRGVGMDVVRSNIQSLSGTVEVLTELGKGTQIRISLPLTLAIIQALVTGVDNRVYVIPLSAVVETFRCDEADVRYLDGKPAINFRGSVLPLIKMSALFGYDSSETSRIEGSATFVVVNTGAVKIGLVVDRLIGEQEVVIKPLGSFFGNLRGIAGATILGDGRVAVIVDVAGIGALVNTRKFQRASLQALEV